MPLAYAAPTPRRRRATAPDASALNSDLVEVRVPPGSAVVGRQILELGLPEQALVVLIGRGQHFVVPRGATAIEEGDTLLLLSDREGLDEVRAIVAER